MANCIVENRQTSQIFHSPMNSLPNKTTVHSAVSDEESIGAQIYFDDGIRTTETFSSRETNKKQITLVGSNLTNIDERNANVMIETSSTKRENFIRRRESITRQDVRPNFETCRSLPLTNNTEQIEFTPFERFHSVNEEVFSASKRFRSRTFTDLTQSMKNEMKFTSSTIYLVPENEIAELIQSTYKILIFDCGSPFRQTSNRIRNASVLQVADKISRKRFKNNPKKDALLQLQQINQYDSVILYDDDMNCDDRVIREIEVTSKDVANSLGIRCVCEEIQSSSVNRFPPIIILNRSFESFSEIYPQLCQSVYTQSLPSTPFSHINDASPSRQLILPHTAPVFSSSGQDIDLFSHPMSHIAHGIFIGSEADAQNLDRLIMEDIQCVVNVTSHLPLYHREKLNYCHIPADDSTKQNLIDYFNEAYSFIEKAVANRRKILVHCVAGISRSPAIVISFLMRYSQMSMNDAYELVKRKRSIIAPNLNFMGQLAQYEKKLRELQ